MKPNMDESREQKMGNLSVVRGALSGGERMARGRSGPRRHVTADPKLNRRVKDVVLRWRNERGYASRRIANIAQELQFPVATLGKAMRDAIDAGVPVDLVAQVGEEIEAHAYELARRQLKPAA